MGATGTVTHIDGDRVYAFGHPFFNLGPTEFPMTRAHVYTMLPSLMSSFKISTMGEMIGTMQQDRATAIAGTLGKGPALMPMTVTLAIRDGAPSAVRPARSHFKLVQRSAVHAAPRLRRALQHARQLRAAVRRRDLHGEEPGDARRATRDLTLEDVFTGDAPILGRLDLGRRPADDAAGNDLEPVTLEGVELTITTSEDAAHRHASSASGSTTCGRAPDARSRSRS